MSMLVTLYSILLTMGAYLLSRVVARKYPSPFTTPVFFSTALIILVLLISNVSFSQYEPAQRIMTFFLGPATVALAVPLYKNRQLISKYSLPALVGLFAGLLSTIISVIFIAQALRLSDEIVASLSTKSVTVPIALEITRIIGGSPALSAAFVVLTGTIGTMLGPWIMNKAGIRSPFAYGLAMGTISHGQGAAQAASTDELAGAVAGVAMGLAAVLTSLLLPPLYSLLF
ncbi:LrgB family protein [Aneurinibacillus sp. REN35]|uniref:LrgB family protein n=1 Tax=Aneurinibacillus sp. REN35 TaxID=3237286 RepID=UPI0035295094